MPLPRLATQGDFEARLGRQVAGADEVRALALLDDASALVRDVAGKTYLDSEGELVDVPHTLMRITVAAALRTFRNPNGFKSESLNAYTYDRGAEAATNDVFLTEAEVADIRRLVAAPTGNLTVGTINLRSAFGSP